MIEPGTKVVCVDASIDPHKREEIARDFDQWVIEKNKYVVREYLDNDGIVPAILLEEVHNKPLFFKTINRVQEPAFGLFRFDICKEDQVSVEASKLVNNG